MVNKNIFRFSLLILSFGIVIFSYSLGLPGSFVHDDFPNIVNNEKLHISDLEIESLTMASTSTRSGPLTRPISLLSFALNYKYFGLNPKSFKIVNILIHLMAGLTLFFLSYLIIDSYKKLSNSEIDSRYSFYIPLFITVAWLMSPINFTAVLYIVQRMTSLATLFSAAGLCCYVLARRKMIFDGINSYYLFLLSGFLFVAALFCKENGALNIFYILCIEFCFFKFASNSSLPRQTFRVLFLFTTLTPLIFLSIWLMLNPYYILEGYANRTFTLSERVLTELRVLMQYIKWTLIPSISELGLFHDDIKISTSLLHPYTTLLSLATHALLLTIALIFLKYQPFLSFGIFFFYSSHIIESTVLPLEIAYEHRNYLASFGLIFGIVTTLALVANHANKKRIIVFVLSLWFCAISITTALRAYQWRSNISFAYFEALHHPESSRAVFNLGKIYANLSIREVLNEKERALQLLKNSMELSPNSIIGESSAIIFCSALDLDIEQSWVANISHKLKSYPINHNTIESLASINDCLASSCKLDLKQVLQFYLTALSNKHPISNKHKSDLLTLYANFVGNFLKEYDIVYNALKDAAEYSPNYLVYRISFIKFLIDSKKYNEARKHIMIVEENDTFRSSIKEIEELKRKLDRHKNSKSISTL